MSKPKVALINPGTSSIYSVHEPLNLGFIAAYLEKNGIEVKIIDQLAGDDVKKEIQQYQPDIVGITATTPVVSVAYEIADFCRQAGRLTVLGGVHASVLPEEAIKHCDIVVGGEGEIAMLKIARGEIKSGIVIGEYIKNLDEIPLPARHLMKMDFYIETRKRIPYNVHLTTLPRKARVGHLLTSRGCSYGQCIFCHNTWRRAPYRADSAEKIISEIKYLRKNYNVDALYYMDDEFLTDRERVIKLCRLILENGLENIRWAIATRVERVDEEILMLMKKAGCWLVNFGFESGSQRILNLLRKGNSVDQAKKAVQLCRKVGIIPHGTFIIGNPGETWEDIELTRRFITENDIISPLVGFLTPYPGTEYWNMLKSKNLLPPKIEDIDWDKLTQERIIINISNIPTGKLKKMRTWMYLKYFWRHKREALLLIFNVLMNPGASLVKIKNTFEPVFNFPKGIFKNAKEKRTN